MTDVLDHPYHFANLGAQRVFFPSNNSVLTLVQFILHQGHIKQHKTGLTEDILMFISIRRRIREFKPVFLRKEAYRARKQAGNHLC